MTLDCRTCSVYWTSRTRPRRDRISAMVVIKVRVHPVPPTYCAVEYGISHLTRSSNHRSLGVVEGNPPVLRAFTT